MLSLVAAAVVFQGLKPKAVIIPMGASPEFHRAAQVVADRLAKSDMTGARLALRLLPQRSIRVLWDDGSVPSASRFDFAQQRDDAFKTWTLGLVKTQFLLAREKLDIKFSFDDGPDVRLKWSEAPGEPRLSAIIGLRPPGGPLDPSAVFNDVEAAIGSYIGITKFPFPGYAMSEDPLPSTQGVPLKALEISFAVSLTAAADDIATEVREGRTVEILSGKMAETPPPLKGGPVLQGSLAPFEIPISNVGSGPLAYRLFPDCGCIATTKTTRIEPGRTGIAQAKMDTAEFYGSVSKHLYLISNDPVEPIRTVPLDIQITPRYRISPGRDQVVIVSGESMPTFEAYLYSPEASPLVVTGVAAEGMPADVAFEPWTGTLPDPELNEGPMPRKGYKLTLTPKDVVAGTRLGSSIVISTTDPAFKRIVYSVYFQKGIIALPQNVFFGEIGAAPRQAMVILSRPGKSFKITGIASNSVHLSATAAPKADGEYRITITYDGKGESGDYSATIVVRTDDPAQPTIEIPVTATVR